MISNKPSIDLTSITWMTVDSKLWLHWIPVHDVNKQLNYIKALQPGGIKIIDPDVSHIYRAFDVSPNSYFVLRNHPLSEEKTQMRSDPVGTGKRHALWWTNKIQEYYTVAASRGQKMPPRDKLIVLGINEPAVWEYLTETVVYTVTFLNELTKYNLAGGALNLNVGWPANTGTDTPPNWTPFNPIYDAIKQGNHWLFLHEYWDFRGPDALWGWHAGRFMKCPWQDIRIVIGEAGVDQHVTDGTGHKGWKHGMNASQYVEQTYNYVSKASKDYRFMGACMFTDDYGSRDWESFDNTAAYAEFLNKNWIFKTPDKPQMKKLRLPFVGRFPITQKFGENLVSYAPYKGHMGVDWATPEGTPLISIDDGIVTEVYELTQLGKYIKIVHDWGESIYAHMSYQHVKINQQVKGGDYIGLSGNTGRSTGPHLHLGTRVYPYDRNDGWDGYSDPLRIIDTNWVTTTTPPEVANPPVVPPVSDKVVEIKLNGPTKFSIIGNFAVEINVNNKHKVNFGV